MNFYYQNIRGLKTKLKEFAVAVSVEDFDVILLTETFLSPDINNEELNLTNYHIFRCDRTVLTSSCTRGGGVLAAVNSQLAVKILQSPITDVEHLFLDVTLKNKNRIIIGLVYIPPSSPVEIYDKFCSSIYMVLESHRTESCEIIICGDFNLPKVCWVNDELGSSPQGRVTQQVSSISDCMAFHNLKQVNKINNVKGGFLDLVFCSNTKEVSIAAKPLLECDVYHPALIFESAYEENVEGMQFEYVYYNFEFANYREINLGLSLVNWDEIIDNTNINHIITDFYNILYYFIDLYVPKCKYKTPLFPKWYDDTLKSLIFKKKAAHKKFKMSGNQCDYNTFSNLRSDCRKYASECYENYIKHIECTMQSKDSFWQFINSKRQSHELPVSMTYNNQTADSTENILNFFMEHFSSVYNNDDDYNNNNNFVSDNVKLPITLNSCDISTLDVFNAISDLKRNLGYGPDGITVKFLKNTKFVLSDFLSKLFNRSLTIGQFPTEWKKAYVIPIFKNGDRCDVNNYRAIMNISLIPKLFESLVCKKITPLFQHIIIPEQHGFMKGRSTISNLLEYQHFLLNALESRCQIDVVYTDFSKAFDKVNHKVLIEKLGSLGIHGPLLKWFNSFLNDRKQAVRIKNCLSSEFTAQSGVPQGGHLSPFLFNCFINDIRDVFKSSKILLYADDMKIMKVINSKRDCEKLQYDINNLVEWCKYNNLTINVGKCKLLSVYRIKYPVMFQYSINNINLERVETIRDLGVLVDKELNFVEHINSIVNRALKLLGFMTRSLKGFHNVFCLKNVYCAVVRSVLEYACTVWSPFYKKHIDILEKVQRKFLRNVAYKLGFSPEEINYEDLLKFLNLASLEARRNYFDMCTFIKMLCGKIDSAKLLELISFHVPSRETRNKILFSFKYHRTNYGLNCPMSRLCKNGNEIDIDVFNCKYEEILPILRQIILC